MNKRHNQLQVLGAPISRLTMDQVIELIQQLVEQGTPHQIITANAEFLVAGQRDPYFRTILRASSLNTADGIGVLWAAKYLSLRTLNIPFIKWIQAFLQLVFSGLTIVFAPNFIRSVIAQKVSGTDLTWELAKLSDQEDYKLFLLGGWGDTSQKAADKLRANFPSVNIVGTYAGSPEDSQVIDMVKHAKPDILLVSFGPITQEKWIYENLQKLGISAVIGVGGTFDYLAGKRPLAPHFLRYIGLEWAFRLITQPWRFKRIFAAVPVFCWYVFMTKIQELKPYRPNVALVVLNEKNQVLTCKRKRSEKLTESTGQEFDHWQFPQGGVDKGEDLQVAAQRELAEETGLTKVEILGLEKDAFAYEWPLEISQNLYGGNYRGQIQSLFFFRADMKKDKVKLDQEEFSEFAWLGSDQILAKLHPIRRDLGKVVLKYIIKYING